MRSTRTYNNGCSCFCRTHPYSRAIGQTIRCMRRRKRMYEGDQTFTLSDTPGDAQHTSYDISYNWKPQPSAPGISPYPACPIRVSGSDYIEKSFSSTNAAIYSFKLSTHATAYPLPANAVVQSAVFTIPLFLPIKIVQSIKTYVFIYNCLHIDSQIRVDQLYQLRGTIVNIFMQSLQLTLL